MADADSDNGGSAKSYHEALGLFIEAFASTEGFLHMLLLHYAKVSPGVGKAVFSGTRIDQTINFIKRIVSVSNPGEPRKSDLEAVLQQLTSINKVRNGIVHFIPLSGIPGDVRHLTDGMRALTEKHRRDISVSIAMLGEMTDDLQKIQTHIWYHLCFDRVPRSVMAMLDKVRSESWRYKPPRQIIGTKSSRREKRTEGGRKEEKLPEDL